METTLQDGINELKSLASAERVEESQALATRLLQQLESASDLSVATADAANQLGVYFSRRMFDDQARRALSRALNMLQACGDRNDILQANIHNNLGQLDDRAGDLESAAAHLETSLRLCQSAAVPATQLATTSDNLGGVLTRLRRFNRAEQLHRDALVAFQQAGPGYAGDVATVLGNIGFHYRARGDFTRARAHLLRAIDMHLRLAPFESGRALPPLINLIALLLDAGSDQQVDEFVDMLLRLGDAEIGARHQAIATAQFEVATLAFGAFKLGLAERLATRAVALFEVTAGENARPTLRALQLLANVHCAKGNHEDAERELLRVLDAAEGDRRQSAELLIDFGRALRSRGRGSFHAAAAIFERAIASLRNPDGPPIAANVPLLASALGHLAQIHAELDEGPHADALFEEALNLGSPRAIGAEYPWLVYSRALLHYHLARHDEALDGMKHALRLWTHQRGRTHPFVATVHANLALVHWAKADRQAALRAFLHAATLQAGDVQRMLMVGSERQRVDAARLTQGDLYKQISLCFDAGAGRPFARCAAQTLLQRKGAVLEAQALTYANLRERLDDITREKFDQLADLQKRIAEQSLGPQLFGAQAHPQEGAACQAEIERLQNELSQSGALGLSALHPATLEAVQAALPADAVLVEYIRWELFDPQRTGQGTPWRGPRYAAMVLEPSGHPHWFDLGEACAIESCVQSLLGLLRDGESDPDHVVVASGEVYKKLAEPFAKRLGQYRTLMLAPDGELNLLPFGVLGLPGQPMLCERFVLAHLTCGRDLLHKPRISHPDAGVLAFVAPDFSAGGGPRGSLNLMPLPGTLKEAQALQSRFADCKIHAGPEASVDALKAVRRPAVLHIATHGLYIEQPQAPRPAWSADSVRLESEVLIFQHAAPSAIDNPMLGAGLALAGANASSPGHPVGLISAAELAGLDLLGTELVVLSACHTGMGVATDGNEFSGLRRAFMMAGADSQVISLWALDDDAAAVLMDDYYRLLATGKGRAEALSKAVQSLRDRPRFAHPNLWAALVAWGQVGPLSTHLVQRGGGAAS